MWRKKLIFWARSARGSSRTAGAAFSLSVFDFHAGYGPSACRLASKLPHTSVIVCKSSRGDFSSKSTKVKLDWKCWLRPFTYSWLKTRCVVFLELVYLYNVYDWISCRHGDGWARFVGSYNYSKFCSASMYLVYVTCTCTCTCTLADVEHMYVLMYVQVTRASYSGPSCQLLAMPFSGLDSLCPAQPEHLIWGTGPCWFSCI